MLKPGQIIFLTISIVATAISFIFFVPWNIVITRLSPLPQSVDQVLEQAVRGRLDGAIVYVDRGENGGSSYAAGWKNRENSIGADPDSLFKIASITKLYVASAVAMMVGDGLLDPDETLAHYLPEISRRITNSDRITLAMLVQHRSGLQNYSDTDNYDWFDDGGDWRKSVELIYDQPARFEPGSRYHYSNTNYVLLGIIMEETLGYSYEQYIQQHILDPLGLKETFFSIHDIDVDDLTSGYITSYCCDLKMIDYTGPPGSMIATASDVAHFVRALHDGSLFGSSRVQDIYSSLYDYGHTGLLPGYSSIARYQSDTDTVTVLFVNTSGDETWGLVEATYQRVIRVLRRSTD